MPVRFDGKEGRLISWCNWGRVTYGIIEFHGSHLRIPFEQLTPIGAKQ